MGDDTSRDVGWIKSSSAQHTIPTEHTAWLYSSTEQINNPTLTDTTLKLNPAFDPEVEELLFDIQRASNPKLNKKLTEKFNLLREKEKKDLILEVDSTKAETLIKDIPDDQLNEVYNIYDIYKIYFKPFCITTQ